MSLATPEAVVLDAARLRRLRRNLSGWYESNARDLPWRRSRDPYRIWISEIMLQQTTVAAVIPYFERFFERFATVDSLAAAGEEDVLKLWEGLGYYSRARNIHKTARLVVERHGGRFPEDVDTLLSLPGIGRYTAGAIASFAFDRSAPIVEANTLRLYCRLLGYEENPRSAAGQRVLWDFAQRVLPSRSCGQFNQALMELGSEICTPVEPNCSGCPLRSCCRAFADGRQNAIPAATPRPVVTHVVEASVAVQKNGAYLLRRRGPGERWEGLWDFQRFSLADFEVPTELKQNATGPGVPAALKQRLEREVANASGIQAAIGPLVAEFHHTVTRYRIRLLCFCADYQTGKLSGRQNVAWVRPSRFADYPLSVTGRNFAKLLAANA